MKIKDNILIKVNNNDLKNGKFVIPNGVTYIGEYAFAYLTLLTEVIIPNTVKKIGAGSFENCTSLKQINIPDSVIDIGNFSFYNCTLLEKVTLSNKLKEIHDYTFLNCESLKEIKIPDGVVTIYDEAFCDCHHLQKVDIPSSVTKICFGAFSNCSSITEIKIPEGTTLSVCCFKACYALKKVKLPSDILSIPSSCFENCWELKTIELPDGIIKIGEDAFSGCQCLQKVDIPSRVKDILSGAFAKCKNIETIKIPINLENIGYNVFYGCESLNNIVISNTIKYNGSNFRSCTSLKNITVLNGLSYTTLSQFSGLKDINITLDTSLFAIDFSEFNEMNIEKLTIYNHTFTDIKNFMDSLREIREEELQDKITSALLNNYIYDNKCFKYSEHKAFINRIINNIETIENYDYRTDFDNYINNYVNEHKPKELVEVKNIQSMLIDINNYNVENISLNNSVQIEQYGIELLDYSLYITSLLSKLQTNSISNIETINLNKILSKITKLKSRNNDDISKLVEKVFFDVSEEGLVLNKTLINKIISYTRYKVCSLKDEINGFEILKEIIKVCIEKINVCKENLSNIEITDGRDIRLLNIDNNSIKNNVNDKIEAFNKCELMLSTRYEQINNLTTFNQIHIDKLKELVTHALPILLQKTTSSKVVLKDKEDVEVLNTVCNTLEKLIKLEEDSKIETNNLETKEEKEKTYKK